MRAALFGMIHVNLHKGYITASSVQTLPHLLSKWVSKLSFYLGCAKSQNLARLREIAKINTRKIIGIPKSQNFVLANNSYIKVPPVLRHPTVLYRRSCAFKRPSDIVLRWSDLTNPRAELARSTDAVVTGVTSSSFRTCMQNIRK